MPPAIWCRTVPRRRRRPLRRAGPAGEGGRPGRPGGDRGCQIHHRPPVAGLAPGSAAMTTALPEAFANSIDNFLTHALAEQGLAAHSIAAYRRDLGDFA